MQHNNLSISVNGLALEDFYIRDEDDSESPPLVSEEPVFFFTFFFFFFFFLFFCLSAKRTRPSGCCGKFAGASWR
jgi:hypothetical protein